MAVVTKAAYPSENSSSCRSDDLGKRCINCNARFFRKDNEDKKVYEDRDTCSRDCAKVVEGFNENARDNYDYRVTDPNMRTCANCHFMHEDSEVGDNCGPCDSGSNFKHVKEVLNVLVFP